MDTFYVRKNMVIQAVYKTSVKCFLMMRQREREREREIFLMNDYFKDYSPSFTEMNDDTKRILKIYQAVDNFFFQINLL
jgi:hypothetical protein